MSDLGGEPACWAHLADDLDTRDTRDTRDTADDRVTTVDLARLGCEGNGAVWALPHDGDLDANVIHLGGDDEIGQHTNDDVDVLVVVWDGTGDLTIGDRTIALHPGVVSLVPRGTDRTIRAGHGGITYVTVHRRRGPLTIGRH